MVSVIIPVYNREKYIRTCICSLMRQSYKEWEALIIDDGSTDKTISLCREMAEKDSRIHLYQCEHKGASAARNTGLSEANGEFVFFLDSDDAIHPFLLEELVKQMENPEVNLSCCGCMMLDDRQMNAKLQNNAFNNEEYESGTEFFTIDEENFMSEFVYEKTPKLYILGGKMFRKSVIGKIRFNEKLCIGEDTVFVYEYALIKGLSAISTIKWYYYRQHSGNTASACKNDLVDIKTRLSAMDLIISRELKRGKTEYVHKWQNLVIARLKGAYERAHKEHNKNSARKIGKVLMARLKIYGRIPDSFFERFKLWVYIYFFPAYRVFNFMILRPDIKILIRIKWICVSFLAKYKSAWCYLRESRCIKKWLK